MKERVIKESLKILKVKGKESVFRRRTDNTMTKRKRTKGQSTIYKTTRSVTLVTNSCPSRVVTRHSFVSYPTFLNPQLLLKHLIETNQTYTYHST